MIAIPVIFILSSINLAKSEDTVWTNDVDGWRIVKRLGHRSCLAATVNDIGQVLGIQLFPNGNKALSFYNVSLNKGETYQLQLTSEDGSSKTVSGIAPENNWVVLEIETDFLVKLVSVGTIVAPDIGRFDVGNSKEAVIAAMHCLQTMV
jgi:hypothetical protein